MTQATMDNSMIGLGIMIGFVLTLGLMGALQWIQRSPITCPALGVVTINDAIVIVRECEDGRIIRDYPWKEDHATDTG